MLKIQLGSKIFQLDLDWRDKEDILTGDYFGVLDYLPRPTFLKSFFESVLSLNPSVALSLDDVDWPQVELDFWLQQTTGQEDTEPDVVIVSNRWVVVRLEGRQSVLRRNSSGVRVVGGHLRRLNADRRGRSQRAGRSETR
jgi:hypothetical protein